MAYRRGSHPWIDANEQHADWDPDTIVERR
jgi:hypothetical protein